MGNKIRIRACVAAIREGSILLVPHYDTDAGPVQWNLPGGSVEFGERLQDAARREFREETGLEVPSISLLDVSKVVLPERPYHSITITYLGSNPEVDVRPEKSQRWGENTPNGFSSPILTASNAIHEL